MLEYKLLETQYEIAYIEVRKKIVQDGDENLTLHVKDLGIPIHHK